MIIYITSWVGMEKNYFLSGKPLKFREFSNIKWVATQIGTYE